MANKTKTKTKTKKKNTTAAEKTAKKAASQQYLLIDNDVVTGTFPSLDDLQFEIENMAALDGVLPEDFTPEEPPSNAPDYYDAWDTPSPLPRFRVFKVTPVPVTLTPAKVTIG